MGRSVDYPNDAIVAFDSIEYEDHDDAQWEWDDYVDGLIYQAMAMFPSMASDSGWIGRENRVLLSNQHAKFGVSEYCGLVAVWLKPNDDGLAQGWAAQVEDKFLKKFGSLRKLGSMSNGEGVYQRV